MCRGSWAVGAPSAERPTPDSIVRVERERAPFFLLLLFLFSRSCARYLAPTSLRDRARLVSENEKEGDREGTRGDGLVIFIETSLFVIIVSSIITDQRDNKYRLYFINLYLDETRNFPIEVAYDDG